MFIEALEELLGSRYFLKIEEEDRCLEEILRKSIYCAVADGALAGFVFGLCGSIYFQSLDKKGEISFCLAAVCGSMALGGVIGRIYGIIRGIKRANSPQ